MISIINGINIILNEVELIFERLSESELCHKPMPEKWSKKEILGHLIDSAQNNIRRVILSQYEEGAHILYDQHVWVNAADYQHYNSNDLCQLFILLNKHFCILIKNLPESKYKIYTNWGKDKPDLVSIEFVIHDYLRHLNHHLGQIKS
jgi:DinB superfamily